MVLISYAQNYEDVVLWRALKHIEKGFYIDVGAWSPDFDSVTKAFYDRGWCGINVEPNPEFKKEYEVKRPRDRTLCVALSDKPGTGSIYLAPGFSGLSSLNKAVLEKNLPSHLVADCLTVEVTTLASIGQKYVADRDVHFLKIDVEGLEKNVLQGNDWSLLRPWIVLVEATIPLSTEENYSAWESILLAADYTFAYADGLNRFYVATEHAELMKALTYPPNVFDEFVSSKLVEAEVAIRIAEARAARAQEELRHVYTSRSWRFTSPLRMLMKLLHRL